MSIISGASLYVLSEIARVLMSSNKELRLGRNGVTFNPFVGSSNPAIGVFNHYTETES